MQIPSISSSYLLQSLRSAVGADTSQASEARQISPSGDTAGSIQGDAGPGGKFAGATLASLLSVQESPAGDMANQLMQQLDTNGDGVLSQDEASAAVGGGKDISSGFAKLDTSGDGSLSSDELKTAIESRVQSQGPSFGGAERPHFGHGRHHAAAAASADASTILSKLDTNGDGALSADEVSSALGTSSSTATTAAATTDGSTATTTTSTTESTTTSATTSTSDAFSALDTDKDGKLSLAELTQGLLKAFGDGRRYGWSTPTDTATTSSASSTKAVA